MRAVGPGRSGWLVTGAFLVFTVLSVVGYATFGLHPGLLPEGDLARGIYAVSFRRFAQLQIALAFLTVAVTLFAVARFRWLFALLLVSGVAFLAEHLGTGYGFPFGGYRYTGLLGPRIGGRVPMLVPLSWFVMAVPSYALASRFLRDAAEGWLRVAIATALLVAWDLALDPAMSFLVPYWIWEDVGPYYGMPWINLLGWTVTGLAIMAVLEVLRADRWMERISVTWLATIYAGVLFMPLGMVAAAGHWPAVVVTLLAVLAPAGVLVLRSRTSRVRHPREDVAPEARVKKGSAAVESGLAAPSRNGTPVTADRS